MIITILITPYKQYVCVRVCETLEAHTPLHTHTHVHVGDRTTAMTSVQGHEGQIM